MDNQRITDEQRAADELEFKHRGGNRMMAEGAHQAVPPRADASMFVPREKQPNRPRRADYEPLDTRMSEKDAADMLERQSIIRRSQQKPTW